MWDIQE